MMDGSLLLRNRFMPTWRKGGAGVKMVGLCDGDDDDEKEEDVVCERFSRGSRMPYTETHKLRVEQRGLRERKKLYVPGCRPAVLNRAISLPLSLSPSRSFSTTTSYRIRKDADAPSRHHKSPSRERSERRRMRWGEVVSVGKKRVSALSGVYASVEARSASSEHFVHPTLA
jgi:hypothetical protein